MKKFFLAIAIALTTVTALSAAESVGAGIWFDSTADNIEGIGFGVPVISNNTTEGASLALCGNSVDKMDGVQFAMFGFNFAESLEGVQLSFINIQDGQHGDFALQWGFYNQAAENGIQIGFLNNAKNNASFQLGFLNINKNGLLPVMIFVNFGKDFFN